MGEYMGGKSFTDSTTTMTPGNLSTSEQSAYDSIFEALGFSKNAQGEYEKTGATGTEQRLSDLATSLEESFAEDYTDPQLEADLTSQEQELRAELSSRLGPDYANTSSGIQALSQFESMANDARTSAKIDREGVMGGLASQTLETLSGAELAGAGTLAGLFGMAGDMRTGRGTWRTTGSTSNRPGGLDYLNALAGPAATGYLAYKMPAAT